MSLPVHQLAWMAGVVDLKGKISRKNNKARATQQIVLFVESKEISIIREMGRMVGTSPEMMRIAEKADFWRKPCVDHCPDQHCHVDSSKFPQVARWTITGAAAAVVLLNLAPYMRVDRGYDVLVTEILQQTVLTGQGAHATVAALRRLEGLGWELPNHFREAVRGQQAAIAESVVAAA